MLIRLLDPSNLIRCGGDIQNPPGSKCMYGGGDPYACT